MNKLYKQINYGLKMSCFLFMGNISKISPKNLSAGGKSKTIDTDLHSRAFKCNQIERQMHQMHKHAQFHRTIALSVSCLSGCIVFALDC